MSLRGTAQIGELAGHESGFGDPPSKVTS
jgi:hypothetical protein